MSGPVSGFKNFGFPSFYKTEIQDGKSWLFFSFAAFDDGVALGVAYSAGMLGIYGKRLHSDYF
jgi:hypothetical protein